MPFLTFEERTPNRIQNKDKISNNLFVLLKKKEEVKKLEDDYRKILEKSALTKFVM